MRETKALLRRIGLSASEQSIRCLFRKEDLEGTLLKAGHRQLKLNSLGSGIHLSNEGELIARKEVERTALITGMDQPLTVVGRPATVLATRSIPRAGVEKRVSENLIQLEFKGFQAKF